jgi:hypothetical protein
VESLRLQLNQWALEKFGEFTPDDVFNLKEEVIRDKEQRPVRHLTLFVKKKKGVKQEWLETATFNIWVGELQKIIGDNLSLKIYSTEGNQMQYKGGLIKADPDNPSKKEYQEVTGNFYNYQFNMDIIKRA